MEKNMKIKKKPLENHNIYKYILQIFRDELVAIVSLLRIMWLVSLIIVVMVFCMFYFVRPFPPDHVRLATGQPNSSLEILGNQYAEEFKLHGVELEIVNTKGAYDNIDLLKNGKVDVAFSIGGTDSGKYCDNVRSLGSVEYQPFWLFYSGKSVGDNPTSLFRSKVFSINIPGSGTRELAEKILTLHGLDIDTSDNLKSLSSKESGEMFFADKIDGVFLTAGIDSKTISDIMSNPNINLFNFSEAKSYTRHLKFLEVVNLPQGAMDLVRNIPRQDIKMVATTTTILVSSEVHPAIQYLFLRTAHKLDKAGHNFFQRPGGFPANIDQHLPLSDTAEKYYNKGDPVFSSDLPYWVSSFIDRVWIILFAMLALAYPLLKLTPNCRALYSNLCLIDFYKELVQLDSQSIQLYSIEQLKEALNDINSLYLKVNNLWVPNANQAQFHYLKKDIESARARILMALQENEVIVESNSVA